MALIGSFTRNFNNMQAVVKHLKQVDGTLNISGSGVITNQTGLGFSGSVSGSTYRITVGTEGYFGSSASFNPNVVPVILSAPAIWQGDIPCALSIPRMQSGLTGTGSFVDYRVNPLSGSVVGSGSLQFSLSIKNSTV